MKKTIENMLRHNLTILFKLSNWPQVPWKMDRHVPRKAVLMTWNNISPHRSSIQVILCGFSKNKGFKEPKSRKSVLHLRIPEPWNKSPPPRSNSPSKTVFKNWLDACSETVFGSDEPQYLFKYFCRVQCPLCMYDQYMLTLTYLRIKFFLNQKDISPRC